MSERDLTASEYNRLMDLLLNCYGREALEVAELMRGKFGASSRRARPGIASTLEELTALPNGAVVRDASGDAFERRSGEWCGYETRPLTDMLLSKYLPAEVLA